MYLCLLCWITEQKPQKYTAASLSYFQYCRYFDLTVMWTLTGQCCTWGFTHYSVGIWGGLPPIHSPPYLSKEWQKRTCFSVANIVTTLHPCLHGSAMIPHESHLFLHCPGPKGASNLILVSICPPAGGGGGTLYIFGFSWFCKPILG